MELGQHDIGLREVLRGRLEGDPVDAPAERSRAQRARAVLRDYKRRAKLLGVSLLASAAGLVGLAASGGDQPFLVPLLGGGVFALFNGVLFVRDTLRLRDVGLSARDAVGERWEEKIAAMDDRPRHVRMAQETARLADPEVLRSPHGRVLREAVDDATMIRETWARLDPADRELVPDVGPTADALLERVSALATNLARLDGAVEAHALPALESRIAEAEAVAAPHDRTGTSPRAAPAPAHVAPGAGDATGRARRPARPRLARPAVAAPGRGEAAGAWRGLRRSATSPAPRRRPAPSRATSAARSTWPTSCGASEPPRRGDPPRQSSTSVHRVLQRLEVGHEAAVRVARGRIDAARDRRRGRRRSRPTACSDSA